MLKCGVLLGQIIDQLNIVNEKSMILQSIRYFVLYRSFSKTLNFSHHLTVSLIRSDAEILFDCGTIYRHSVFIKCSFLGEAA